MLWFGADRIASGDTADRRADRLPQLPHPDPHVGDDGHVRGHAGAPGRGLRRADPGGARHRRRRSWSPATPVTELAPPAARSSCATSASTTRAPRRRCSPTSRSRAAGRARPPPSSAAPARARRRCSTWSPACSTPPPARCSSTASTSATSTPRCCGAASGWSPRSRTCSPAPWPATCATPTPTPPTTSCGRRSRSPRPPTSWPAMPGGLDARIEPGRHQRVGRAAPAPGHRPGAGPPARDLPLRRLVLGPRPRHRRPAAGRAGAAHRATPPCSSSPSGSRPSPTPTRSWCSRTGAVVGLGTHDELLATCPTYAEIVASQLGRGGGGMSTHRRAPPAHGPATAATGRPRRQPGRHRAPGRVGWAPSACRPRSRRTSASSTRRLLPRLRPERRGGVAVVVLWPLVSVTLSVVGPQILGHATNIDLRRPPERPAAAGIDFAALHRMLLAGARPLRGVLGCSPTCRRTCWPASCSARCTACAPTSRTSSTGCRWLRRPPAPRRPAQPGHQRHRQRRPEPAADAQPAAHVDR